MRVHVFLGGLLFALLQSCYFLLLEAQLSSAWSTYMAVTVGWLAGSLGGLRVVRAPRRDAAFIAASLAAYYGTWAGLRSRPFDERLLPAYALGVAVSGAYAGYFLRANAERSADPRRTLLMENNGFIAGLISAFIGFFLVGEPFLVSAPALAGLACLLSAGGPPEKPRT